MNKLKYFKISFGELAERLNATAWSAVGPATVPGVQIPHSPPYFVYATLAQLVERLTCNEVGVSSIKTGGSNFSGSSSTGIKEQRPSKP